MLAGLLKNEIAVQVSINIMNAFVELRKFISLNEQVFERLINIENKLLEHNNKINQIFSEREEINNIEIAELINEEYGKSYTANYISTVDRKSVV